MFGAGDSSYIIKLRGLPFSTKVKDILEFLKGVNVVNGSEGVHMTEVRPGRPSGEAFVEVASQEDVEEAMKKDKQHMGKRYIEVFTTDRQDMEWALNAMRETDDDFDMPNVSDKMGVVKLRGLPYGCSKDEVVQFFDGLPVCEDGVTLLSDGTGRSSGEAFVHFADRASAQAALEKDREKIGHRYIEVFLSNADEIRQYSNRMDGGSRSNRFSRPTPYDRGDRFGGPGRFNRAGPRGGFGGGSGGFGGSGGSGFNGGGFNGGGLGGGFNGGGMGGGMGGGFNGGGMGGGLGGGFNSGGMGGGGMGGGGGLGSSDCLPNTVHMRGLPFRATPQDIAFFFKPIHPMNVNILFDKSGRPSGEADVEFECHEDALRAMRRDKNNMDNRYIELFLNSTPAPPPPFASNNRYRSNY